MSATQKALSCVDVLHEIFGHLAEFSLYIPSPPDSDTLSYNDEPRECRRALLHAALVCRTFSGPALDRLWATLPGGLRPLFSLLPPFKKTSVEMSRIPGITDIRVTYDWKLLVKIPPESWERFNQYARRVRFVVYSARFPLSFDATYLGKLQLQHTRPKVLLPRLHSLRLDGESLSAMFKEKGYVCSSLTPPSLRSLYLTGSIPRALGPQIQSAFKHVKHLCMRGPSHRHDLKELHRFPSLLKLELSLDQTAIPLAFSEMGRFDELTELEVTCSKSYREGEPEQGDYKSGFPSLRRLKISAQLACLMKFLPSIASTAIDNVDIEVKESTSFDDVQLMLGALCSRNTETLTHLSLAVSEPNINNPRKNPVPTTRFRDFVADILSCPNLVHLDLSIYGQIFSMTDSDVVAMQDAWPQLEHLSIGCNYYTSTTKSKARPTRPSVHTLVTLAENCTSLSTLRLETRNVTKTDLQKLRTRLAKSDGPLQGSLRRIGLAASDRSDTFTIADAKGLARILQEMFPGLEGVREYRRRRRREETRSQESIWYDGHGYRDSTNLLEAFDDVWPPRY